jgi:hypothetical protein
LAEVPAHLLSGGLPAATPVFSSASKSGPHVRERSNAASFQTNFLQNHRRAIAYDQVEFRLLDVNAYCRPSGDHGLIEGYSNIRTTATLFPIICMGNQPPTSSFICGFARLAVTVHLLSGIQRVGRCDPTPWIWIDAICINQMNNEEIAGQTRLRRSYSPLQYLN